MPSRQNPVHDAIRRSEWIRMEIGAELRIARVSAGFTQRQVGRAIGRSASRISRIEGARVPRLSLEELSMAAAAVGMKLYVRIYPQWRRQLEAPMPIPGDLRAVDELIRTDECACAVEAYTRLADVGRQLRLSRTKQRDIKADRLIWVVKGSRANRRLLHEAGPLLIQELPVGTRSAMRALAAGEDPGADCLIVL
jgi:transcriptional regulator with XRE-family HTH domain